MPPSILLDDSDLKINLDLLGNTWTHQNGKNGVYNQTITVWNAGSQSFIPPELSLFYFGGDINFYGTMTSNLAANYTIDGTTLRPVPFPTGIANGRTGINLFSLQNLTDGLSHNINIFPVSGQFTLDYVTYLPNADTTLQGVDLILDNSDPGLQYSSAHWNHTTGDFNAGRPHNGTMSGTNTIGATMQLTFVGSDISVYGLLNQVDGRLSASFTIDNQVPVLYNPFKGEQGEGSPTNWTLASQFFHQDLTPGQHKLVVNLTDVSGAQMLWVDYVVFQGTASTKLGLPSPSSPGTSSGGGLGANNNNNSMPFSKGAIAGIAFGGFLFAAVFLGFLRRRLRRPSYSTVVPVRIDPPNSVSSFPPVLPPPPPLAPQMTMTHQFNPPTGPINNYYNVYREPSHATALIPALSSPTYTHAQQHPSNYNNPASHSEIAPAAAPRPSAAWDGASGAPSPRTTSTGPVSATNPIYPHTPSDDTSYYTYDAKQGSVALGWGTAPSPGSSTPGSAHQLLNQGRDQTQNPAAHTDGWTPPVSWGAPAAHPTSLLDGAAAHGVNERQLNGRSDARSNHAHEDGRDDDDGFVGAGIDEVGSVVRPQRERDAGPLRDMDTLPPAYDDRADGGL